LPGREIGASRVNGSVALAFRVFGRPPRTTACDCERSSDPGLAQKLFLMADDTLVNKFKAPNNRLKQLLADHKDDDEALDRIVSRRTDTAADRKGTREFHRLPSGTQGPSGGVRHALWALVNTSEFILNH